MIEADLLLNHKEAFLLETGMLLLYIFIDMPSSPRDEGRIQRQVDWFLRFRPIAVIALICCT